MLSNLGLLGILILCGYFGAAISQSRKGRLEFFHPERGVSKLAPLGFSWTTLIFGFFPALFRGHLTAAFIIFVLNLGTAGLAGLIFAFFYNNWYVKSLIKRGFIVSNETGGFEKSNKAQKFDSKKAKLEPQIKQNHHEHKLPISEDRDNIMDKKKSDIITQPLILINEKALTADGAAKPESLNNNGPQLNNKIAEMNGIELNDAIYAACKFKDKDQLLSLLIMSGIDVKSNCAPYCLRSNTGEKKVLESDMELFNFGKRYAMQ